MSGGTAALRPALEGLVGFYESLAPASLAGLARHYAADARFVDPFNDVIGLPAIERIFADMFERLDAPRFVVGARYLAEDGNAEAMLLWRLHFRSRLLGPGEHAIEGTTRLVFDAACRVRLHRDYWDAAGELYARLPLIGWPLRALGRRLAAR